MPATTSRDPAGGLALCKFGRHLGESLEVACLNAVLDPLSLKHAVRLDGKGCRERRLARDVIQPPTNRRLIRQIREQPSTSPNSMFTWLVERRTYRWTATLVIAHDLGTHRSLAEKG